MRINTIFSKMKKVSKKAFLVVMLPLLSIAMLGLVSNAAHASDVLMEGDIKALNVTKGQTAYQDNTSAMVDEVVQAQVWYHNREIPGGEVAKNVQVKIDVPTKEGKQQVITSTTSSDNSNTVKDTTNVNLSLDRAYMEYIPGSAKWRYNKAAMDGDVSCQTGMNFAPERCYATVPISDAVVTSPQGVNLGNAPGCNAYHATVTIQVRVKANVVSVNKFARHKGEGSDAWKTSITAKPDERLEYLITFKNEGNTQLNDVMVADNLPKYNSYVDNTTHLRNGANPNGVAITNNNLTKGGINVGNYLPGAVSYVWFEAKLDPIQAYPKCGVYDVRNVGVVRPAGMNEFYNTASVKINVECSEVTKSFTCDALAVQQLSDTSFRFTANGSAQNATITGYTFALNGATVQDSANNTYTLNQTQPGDYTVSVIVKTDQGNTAPNAACTKTITVKEKPKTPTFSCDLLTLTKIGDRKVRLAVDASAAGGATIKRYIYNFGDGSQALTTDKNIVEHDYTKDGTFTASVQVVVDSDGKGTEKTITSDKCAAPIKFVPPTCVDNPKTPEDECNPCVDNPNTPVNECKPTTPPSTPGGSLPNTGPGSVAAIFVAVTVAGTAVYNFAARRFSL